MNTLVESPTPRGLQDAGIVAGAQIKSLIPTSFEGVWRMAQLISASPFAPKDMRTPESCAVAITLGLDLGIPPIQAVQSIAVINGRPSIWGDLALALCLAHPLCEGVDEEVTGDGDTLKAVVTAHRKGSSKPKVGVFSADDAKAANLWNKEGPWRQYKRRMVQLRARAFALRDAFPDVLKGVAIREEVEDIVVVSKELLRPPGSAAPVAPAIEDATVTDVIDQETGEITQQQEQQKTQEAKPAEAKAEPPKAKRKPNGWPALFQNARLVIEDGIFTKDVNDPESVGNQAEEADYADADLILTNGVITKQPGTVAKMTDAEIEQAMATVGTAFEHCDSMDALEVVKQSNKELYERLKAQDAHQPFIAIFRAAETRIKEADLRAEQEENEKAAKQQGDPVSSEERGEPVDDTFPGDRPSKAVETKSSADEMPVKNAIDPATLSPDLIPLLAMSSDDYTIYVRDYLAAFLAAKAEPVAVKRKFNSEDPVRTYIGMSDAARKELRRLRDEIVADLSGE